MIYGSITRDQVRVARLLLHWSPERLAIASGTSAYVVEVYEQWGRLPVGYPLASAADPVSALCRTLEAAGVEFIPGNSGGAGVRLKARAT